MLTLIIAIFISLSVGACFGFLIASIFRTAGCILLACLILAPAPAEALTKRECMQIGYGCQWSKATGGRANGWFFTETKAGTQLRQGRERYVRKHQETDGPTRPSSASTSRPDPVAEGKRLADEIWSWRDMTWPMALPEAKRLMAEFITEQQRAKMAEVGR
jgi:hypothetical protein